MSLFADKATHCTCNLYIFHCLYSILYFKKDQVTKNHPCISLCTSITRLARLTLHASDLFLHRADIALRDINVIPDSEAGAGNLQAPETALTVDSVTYGPPNSRDILCKSKYCNSKVYN